MTWLLLSAPVQPQGQREQIMRRRFNMNHVLMYEPNAMGSTIVVLGMPGAMQVVQTVEQIDAAMNDINHPLRVEEQATQRVNVETPNSFYQTFLKNGVPK